MNFCENGRGMPVKLRRVSVLFVNNKPDSRMRDKERKTIERIGSPPRKRATDKGGISRAMPELQFRGGPAAGSRQGKALRAARSSAEKLPKLSPLWPSSRLSVTALSGHALRFSYQRSAYPSTELFSGSRRSPRIR